MKTKLFLFSALAAMLLAGCDTTTEPPIPPDPEKYAISIGEVENGEVTATVDGQPVTEAEADTEITITATANEGYEFAKWVITGADPDEATDETTFTMPKGNVTIVAEFTEIVVPPTEYDITVTPAENGEIAVTVDDEPVAKAVADTEITITATADDGYEFVKWIIMGATPDEETEETTTFTMPEAAVTVEAEFALLPPTEYDITVTPANHGEIAVTVDDEPIVKAIADTEITITATANDGYMFVKWIITGATPENVNAETTTFTMPESNVTVAAEFKTDPSTYDEGVVINGVKWATRNVDAPGTFAETSESAGMFYQWGINIGWSSEDPLVNSDGGTTWTPTEYDGSEWTEDNDPSPKGWRVPTMDDLQKLCDASKVSRTWSTSPLGYTFTDIATGASMFVPAFGYRNYSNGTISGRVGMPLGNYWSSTPSPFSPIMSYYLQFLSSNANASTLGSRSYGNHIRPVTAE